MKVKGQNSVWMDVAYHHNKQYINSIYVYRERCLQARIGYTGIKVTGNPIRRTRYRNNNMDPKSLKAVDSNLDY